VITADAPSTAAVGAKDTTLGVTLKLAALVAVPPLVETVILPDVAVAGTVVVIDVVETSLNDVATPLNFTLVAPVNVDPVIVTFVPTTPPSGENFEIFGAVATARTTPAAPTAVAASTNPPRCADCAVGFANAGCVVSNAARFWVGATACASPATWADAGPADVVTQSARTARRVSR